MDLGEAITTALEYEARVHQVYQEAVDEAETDIARKVFATLREEELGHLKFLRERLAEWQDTGTVTQTDLETVLVSKDEIESGANELRSRLESTGRSGSNSEIELLRRALAVERETSAFYAKMAAELDNEGKALFERFVEIEGGHLAIVQAEIDCVSGSGFWFDTAEFSLEKF